MMQVPDQRAIIDRRALSAAIGEVAAQANGEQRPAIVGLLRDALTRGREEMGRRLLAAPAAGHEIAAGYTFLVDQLVRAILTKQFRDRAGNDHQQQEGENPAFDRQIAQQRPGRAAPATCTGATADTSRVPPPPSLRRAALW